MEEGVEIIGTTAFMDCYKLKDISMPESLIEIKYGAFFRCSSLKKIKVPSKITKIEQNTFGYASNLEEIILSDNTESISIGAFSATKFKEIVIPEKVKEIEIGAFQGNKQLSNIIIEGKNPQYVYENGMLMSKNKDNIVFISDKYLRNINTFAIPDGIIKFNIGLNEYTNITKIIIPETIEYISVDKLPTSINEIELANTNKKYYIDENKKILYKKDAKEIIMCYSKEENIDLQGEDILRIASYAFNQATNAKSIILPNSLKSIGTQVFTNCKKIEEIKIGPNVDSIDPLFKYGNYTGKVTIDKDNPNFIIENDILYNKDKTKLLKVLYWIEGEFYIDENVQQIGNLAFHSQYGMTDINIPKSVKEIQNSFNYCSGLVEVNIPNNVEKIHQSTFGQCHKLERINVDKEKDSISGAPWGAIKGMRVVKWLR